MFRPEEPDCRTLKCLSGKRSTFNVQKVQCAWTNQVKARHEPYLQRRTAGPPDPQRRRGEKLWESPNAPAPVELLRDFAPPKRYPVGPRERLRPRRRVGT